MCPALRSMPEEAPPPPGGEELGALLLGEAEAYDWGAVANLDAFFTRIYRWVGTCGVQREGGEGQSASPPAVEGGHICGARQPRYPQRDTAGSQRRCIVMRSVPHPPTPTPPLAAQPGWNPNELFRRSSYWRAAGSHFFCCPPPGPCRRRRRYWEAKGFGVMLLSRLLNLAALGFTVLMSALLLLYVNWGALQAECLRRDTCDLMQVGGAGAGGGVWLGSGGRVRGAVLLWVEAGHAALPCSENTVQGAVWQQVATASSRAGRAWGEVVTASPTGCQTLCAARPSPRCCCCCPPAAQVAFRRHPLEGGLTLGRGLAVLYLLAFSAYWLVAAVSGGG